MGSSSSSSSSSKGSSINRNSNSNSNSESGRSNSSSGNNTNYSSNGNHCDDGNNANYFFTSRPTKTPKTATKSTSVLTTAKAQRQPLLLRLLGNELQYLSFRVFVGHAAALKQVQHSHHFPELDRTS